MAGITVSIGSGVAKSIYGDSQAPIKSFLIKRAEAFEQESVLKQIFRMETSTHFAEGYSGETAMDNFLPVGEGGSYPKLDFEESYKQILQNETWKASFAVTQELVEDAQIGTMRQRANKLITAYYRTREQFGRMLYAGALSADSVAIGSKVFSTKAADGQRLFSKEHPAKVKGGNQTNLFTGTFSAANLGKVETRMQNMKGDNGELLAVAPDTIWIPNDAAMKNSVFEAIGADKDPGTSNNGFNYHFGRWNVIVDPYLSQALSALGISDVPWVLLDSRFVEMNDGAVFQDRVKLHVQSEIDKDNDNNIWKARARFAAGFVDWRFCAVGNITGGTAL